MTDACALSATYPASQVRVGQRLYCERRRALVTVRRFTRGPARWPMGRPDDSGSGGSAVILAGRLLLALHHEAAADVCSWLGVSKTVVSKLRKALGVELFNPGAEKRRAATKVSWDTEEDDRAIMTLPMREAVAKTGRSYRSVATRKSTLRKRAEKCGLACLLPAKGHTLPAHPPEAE